MRGAKITTTGSTAVKTAAATHQQKVNVDVLRQEEAHITIKETYDNRK